jgi:hypothetical protein
MGHRLKSAKILTEAVMRRLALRTSIIVFLLIVVGAYFYPKGTLAQTWRDIEPVKSTCKDVERLLGGNPCGQQNTQYNLVDATVVFVFADSPCHANWPHEQYNLAPGAVRFIRVFIKPPYTLTVSDFGIDKAALRQNANSDELDIFKFESHERGIKIAATQDGELIGIDFFPATKHDSLRCSNSDKGKPANEPTAYGAASHLVGEYSPSDDSQKKLIYDELLSKLNKFDKGTPKQRLATVYIVAYAGQQSSTGEAKRQLKSAKNTLISEFNIDEKRIIEIDGGYRENSVVQLFIRPFGVPAPDIMPTIHPSKVELLDENENSKP